MTTATRSKPTTRETWTRRNPDGTVLALSSDGSTIYRIDLVARTCACAGFAFRSQCRHLAAALARYAEPTGCPVCAASPLSICPSCASVPAPQGCDLCDLYPPERGKSCRECGRVG